MLFLLQIRITPPSNPFGATAFHSGKFVDAVHTLPLEGVFVQMVVAEYGLVERHH